MSSTKVKAFTSETERRVDDQFETLLRKFESHESNIEALLLQHQANMMRVLGKKPSKIRVPQVTEPPPEDISSIHKSPSQKTVNFEDEIQVVDKEWKPKNSISAWVKPAPPDEPAPSERLSEITDPEKDADRHSRRSSDRLSCAGNAMEQTPTMRSSKTGREDRVSIQSFAEKERMVQMNIWGHGGSRIGSEMPTFKSEMSYHPRWMALKVVKRSWFEPLIVILIVANSIVIGVQADWSVKNPKDQTPTAFEILDHAFFVCFLIEIILRLLAHGSHFFSRENKGFAWNVFDATVLATAALDKVLAPLASAPGTLAMRLLRLLRIARVLRVIRMFRFFQDLRVLLAGIMASMKSLVWALTLSLMLAFMVGVCIMDFVAMELAKDTLQHETVVALNDIYGSMFRTLFAMYQAVTNGLDWGTMTDPLWEISWTLPLLFSVYIAVAVLCVLNIITGLFVENAKRLSQQDETQFIMETVASRKIWLEEVKQLFARVADPETGSLNAEDFAESVSDVRVQVYFKKLGIDVEPENAQGLFELLDFQGDGFVDLDEFALGIQMLHGSARSIDMARMRYFIHNVDKQVSELVELMRGITGVETGQASLASSQSFGGDAKPAPGGMRKQTSNPRFHIPGNCLEDA